MARAAVVAGDLRRPHSGNASARVFAWARGVAAGSLYLSVITLLELEIGVLRMERRDPRQAQGLRRWLDGQVRPAFAGRVLGVDERVATHCAPLHVPDPGAERDMLVAATALAHGMTVVTRNVRDFAGTGAMVLDPWRA